jgi:hypothetical protein
LRRRVVRFLVRAAFLPAALRLRLLAARVRAAFLAAADLLLFVPRFRVVLRRAGDLRRVVFLLVVFLRAIFLPFPVFDRVVVLRLVDFFRLFGGFTMITSCRVIDVGLCLIAFTVDISRRPISICRSMTIIRNVSVSHIRNAGYWL